MVYGAGKLPLVMVPVLKVQGTAIVSERKLLHSFSMWANNVSSSHEGYYYTVGAQSKQRM